MRLKYILSLLSVLCFTYASGENVYYVAQNGQLPQSPYGSLETAAENIQDVVNIAPDLATILVDAGRYTFSDVSVNIGSNVVNIDKSITLKSIKGAAETFIDGEGKYRVVRFAIGSAAKEIGPAVVDGFTITNGYAGYPTELCRGGGVYFDTAGSTTAIVQNCTITGNVVEQNQLVATDKYQGGGGIYCYGAKMPIVSNCVVIGNQNAQGTEGRGTGGGLYFKTNGQILDSIFAYNDNSAMYFAATSEQPRTLVDRCIVVSNTLGIRAYAYADVRNSLIARNQGTGVNAEYTFNIYNSTVVLNGGNDIYYTKNQTAGILKNCILGKVVIQNSDVTVAGYHNYLSSVPSLGEWHDSVEWGNDVGVLKFVDAENNDFRLLPDSPCVNAGTDDLEWLTGESLDLAKRRRVDWFSASASGAARQSLLQKFCALSVFSQAVKARSQ